MPHGLDGLVLAASLGEILGGLFVAAVAAGCHRAYSRSHLKPWAGSWLAAALASTLAMVSALLTPLSPPAAAASSATIVLLRLVQLASFLIGARAFQVGSFRAPAGRRVGLAAAGALALMAVAALAESSAARALARAIPALLLGVAFLWAGLAALRRHPARQGVGVRLVGGALVPYGAVRLHDAGLHLMLLAGAPFFGTHSLLLGFVDFALMTGLGLGLVQSLLDDESRRAARAEAERRAHERELERERDRLRVSEEKFEKVFRSSPDAIIITAPWDGARIIDVNEGFERLSGYTAAEAIGRTTLDLGLWLRPDDRERLARRLEQQGRDRDQDVEFRARNGERRLCLVSGEVIEIGGERYAVTVTRDVTAQREAEQRLRDSEERLRRISEAAFEGIGFSEQGVMVDVNAQLAAMLGYEPEELIGLQVLSCVAPEDRSRVAEALRSGHAGAYEHRALRKDGSVFPVEIRARSLTVQGRAVRVTAVRDLSERTRLEAELRRRETLAAMGSLVAAVAHEVRTPLFSVSATLDALEAGSPAPEQERELKDLLGSQVRRLSSLMEDLLDYGRPPALTLVPGEIREAVERAVRACRPLAAESGVQIALAIPTGLPPLSADGRRLEQVFANLVANAVQHSPRGATVRVSVSPATGEPCGLVCRVEDDGPGIRAEDLESVFAPFFSRRRGGTGMGLAIAQRLVEAHGGLLTAANRPQGGAQFTVLLPLPHAASAGDAIA